MMTQEAETQMGTVEADHHQEVAFQDSDYQEVEAQEACADSTLDCSSDREHSTAKHATGDFGA